MAKKKKQKKLKKSAIIMRNFTKEEKMCCEVIRYTFKEVKTNIYDLLLETFSQIEETFFELLDRYHRSASDNTMLIKYCDTINLMLDRDVTERIKILKELEKEDSDFAKGFYETLLNTDLDLTEEKVTKPILNFISFRAEEILSVLGDAMKGAIHDGTMTSVMGIKEEYINTAIGVLEDQVEEFGIEKRVNFERLREYSVAFLEESFSKAYINTLIDEITNVSITEKCDTISREIYSKSLEIIQEKFSETVFEDIQIEVSKEFNLMSWRDLEKKILDKNFELVRSNGDHGIYRNPKGHIIVMPRGRDIGKGLQIKILKQLEEC